MPHREAELSGNEKAFVLKALQEKIRLDGRGFDDYRKFQLSFGDEYGVADVTLGRTRYASPFDTNPYPPLTRAGSW
jgi:exosome complex component RRP45